MSSEERQLRGRYRTFAISGSGEDSSLLPERTERGHFRSRGSSRAGNTALNWFRWLLLVGVIVAVVFVFLYFNKRVEKEDVSQEALNQKVKALTEQVSTLQTSLDLANGKLKHLEWKSNQTVTNHDLIEEVRQKTAEQNALIIKERETMKTELQETIVKLNRTVDQAHESIKQDLLLVKGSVDRYESVTKEQLQNAHDFMLYQLTGMFTLLTCLIALWHMNSHVTHWNKPEVQKKILAILWMPPIYAVCCWLSLVFAKFEPALEIVTSSFEAYVIYMFMALMVSHIANGDQQGTIRSRRRGSQDIPWEWESVIRIFERKEVPPSLRCCGKFKTPRDAFYLLMGFGIQFVLIVPFVSICNWIFHLENVTGGWWDVRCPYFYTSMVSNISVTFALYALYKFYHITHDERAIASINPWPKFLCIKGVIFMTYYQGIVLDVLANVGFVDGNTGRVAQNFIICIEMFLAALVHPFVFGYEECQPGYEYVHKLGAGDSVALPDFFRDVRMLLKTRRPRKVKIDEVSPGDSDDEVLLQSEGGDLLNEEFVEQIKEIAEKHSIHLDESDTNKNSDPDSEGLPNRGVDLL